jgi:hypothetical protein
LASAVSARIQKIAMFVTNHQRTPTTLRGSALAQPAAMSSSLDLLLRRLRDPRWIPHISDYCDSRCNRCAFTERCRSFVLQQHERGVAAGEPSSADHESEAEPEMPPITEMQHIIGWTERHGIDLDDLEPDAADIKEYERREKRIDSDALVERARDYADDVYRVLRPLLEIERHEAPTELGAEVAEAIGDVYGLSLRISVKVHRAISSFEFNKDEDLEVDPLQNDSNGSTKVVILAISETIAAWEIIQRASVIDAWLVNHLVETLKQIGADLSERFPLAMGFVRPGFDEEIPGLVRPWSLDPVADEEEEHGRSE